ncbi:MAG: hypothetical protein EOP49_06405 [Sphingobacteriales bacterium]|nr:MAG: hypothetical protein EOP49_06405 [Sphingobacteriales bacterium]
MSKVKRKFTPEERLSILHDAERNGRTETLRKYSVARPFSNDGKMKYLTGGVEGLKNAHRRIDH